ncbi:conserved hypothetical protein [Luteimonas sp. 9C]|uniref:DUF6587 family protein n=1 Tax=Luteimonas sp. 9C TaxID=2653148 RepID=UPI0012F22270|nr:DUF6587 family protein [Luteimonas sp. 9C]VXB34245.1 conserved hypothetical protein [Luteimonas sp. 9C]
MTAGLFLQYIVVALAVLLSAWVVLKQQAPNAARRLRIAFALPLLRDGRPAWIRAVGRRIAPVPIAANTCGGCDSCGPPRR